MFRALCLLLQEGADLIILLRWKPQSLLCYHPCSTQILPPASHIRAIQSNTGHLEPLDFIGRKPRNLSETGHCIYFQFLLHYTRKVQHYAIPFHEKQLACTACQALKNKYKKINEKNKKGKKMKTKTTHKNVFSGSYMSSS